MIDVLKLSSTIFKGCAHLAFDPKLNIAQNYSKKIIEQLGVQIVMEKDFPEFPFMGFCNHQSWLDIPLLCSLKPFRFIAKKEVKKFPLFGNIAKNTDTIFVTRGKPLEKEIADQILHEFQKGKESILCFPEGTTQKFPIKIKKGLIQFAQTFQIPSVVITLEYDPQDLVLWVGDDYLVPSIYEILKYKKPIIVKISWKILKQKQYYEQIDQYFRETLWKDKASMTTLVAPI